MGYLSTMIPNGTYRAAITPKDLQAAGASAAFA
jgi:hypothetical protein